MKDLERDSIDFGKGKIRPLFHSIFFPTLLSMVFTSLLTVADGIFVGQGVGSDALAAINIVAPLFLVTTGIALMFGVGVSVVASIHLAQGNNKAADINVTQALEVAPLLMALIAVILYFFRNAFLHLLGCSDVLLPLALQYLIPLLPGCVFILIQTIGTFIIRLDGAPKYASAVGVVPGLLNIFLDWLLVFPMQMGIAGSSVATTLCCAIAAGMVAWYMFRKSRKLHFYRLKMSRTSLYLTARNIGYMALSGFSSMLGELAMSMIMITGNYLFIRTLGEDGVAAFSVACYLYPIVFMVNNSVAQSAQPIISYNYGAGNGDRVRETFRLRVRGMDRASAAKDMPPSRAVCRSSHPCRMSAALILSTEVGSLLSRAFMPPSIIARCARTDVKRSSSSVTGISGKALRSFSRKTWTSAAASAGVLSRFLGKPTTKRVIDSPRA